MPDISNADLVGLAGTFVASLIAGLGLKRGGEEAKSLPAPNESHAAGVFVGLDATVEKGILDEIRALHTDMRAWRQEDKDERRADELQDAREQASALRAQVARLQEGQHKTHESNDAIRDMLTELLSDPEVAERARHIRQTPKAKNARLLPPDG